MTIGLFTPSAAYKPFRYPWAYEAWEAHEVEMHWSFHEVPLGDDVKDWGNKLNDSERNLINQIFRLFTQADVEVENAYLDLYMPKFKPTEIRMMLSSFAAREAMHQASYSYLLDTLGMPETDYAAFREYSEMSDKCEYLKQFNMDTPHNTALCIAAFAAFTEGLQLFASFAILLSFPRFNKLKGMGQIVSWSIRDESWHVLFGIMLFHTLLSEDHSIDQEQLKTDIRSACSEIVHNEYAFIDKCFEMGDVEGMTSDQSKSFVRFVADMRLKQLGCEPLYNEPENPLPWFDEMTNAIEQANFFESRSTEYTRGATQGDWDDDVFS